MNAPNLHPLVKLLSIVSISGFVGQTGWNGIFFTIIVLLPFYSNKWDLYKSAWIMLYRMKWLFFSIAVLYLFLLPTESLQHYDTYTTSNFLLISYRMSILAVIIFSVNLLIKTSSKEEIISALYLLIQPLTKVGINLESFLIRAYLTIDFVDKLNSDLIKQKQKQKQKQPSQKIIPFIVSWLEDSMHNNRVEIIIEKLSYPNLLQCLIPVFLCFCYIILNY